MRTPGDAPGVSLFRQTDYSQRRLDLTGCDRRTERSTACHAQHATTTSNTPIDEPKHSGNHLAHVRVQKPFTDGVSPSGFEKVGWPVAKSKRAGRLPKLTPETQASIVRDIAAGVPREHAAERAGTPTPTSASRATH